MSFQEEFVEIYRENIHRDGSEKLLDYLCHKSDFFTAPLAVSGPGACEGGLCEHSLNVYHCLLDYLLRERVQELYGLEYSPETIAVTSLLHEVHAIGCFHRDAQGHYAFHDPLPYGKGEKSVYIINGFLRLTREEALAIRWYAGPEPGADAVLLDTAFRKHRLSLALHIADLEATYLLDDLEN